MSQTGKVKPKKKRGMRIFAWVLLALLLGIIVAAALVWKNRNQLLEGQVRKKLAEMGYDAALEIENFDQEAATLKNISLSQNGAAFFTASELELKYDYKDALKGEFKRILIRQPEVSVTLDAQGKITNDWALMGAGGGAKFVLPEDGFVAEEGSLVWQAPFGQGAAMVSADIKSPHAWSFMIDSADTVLRQGDVSLKLDYHGVLEQFSDDEFNGFGTVSTKTLDTPALKTGPVKMDFNLVFSRGDNAENLDIKGWVNMSGQNVQGADYNLKDAHLKLDMDGMFEGGTRTIKRLGAKWDVAGVDVAVTNAEKRAGWSDMLTSDKILENTPIARYFTGFLQRKIDKLMQGFNVNGAGGFVYNSAGYQVVLDRHLMLANSAQSIVIKPKNGVATMVYDAAQGQLTTRANVDWTGARGLKIDGFKLVGTSLDGLRLDGLKSLEAGLQSRAPWTAKIDGQDFRLAPFDVDFKYRRDDQRSHVDLAGALDYDGLVPGGAAQGLRARGAMQVDIKGDAFTLGYSPDGPVQMQNFISASGWRAEGLEFDISGADKLMQRNAGGQPMRVTLGNVKTQIISPDDDRHLQAKFDSIQVNTDFSVSPQKWDLALKGIEMSSNDFPSPGTHILADQGRLSVLMGENGDMEFEAASPDTFVETDNVTAKNMQIIVAGQPDDFTASYKIGNVAFKSGDIPAAPVQGTARLKNGVLTGQAVAALPDTKDMPINIDFRSENGFGSAQVNVTKILFMPRGLQPQYLVPTLTGKLADVSGEVSADVKLGFGGGAPVSSSGTVKLKNLDVGTLVGPFTGVNAELRFSDMFPLKSDGVQTATLSGFDPGFPLEDGRIQFEIIPGGVRIIEALWPVKNITGSVGRIYIAPVNWRFGNAVNRVTVHIEDVDLGTMLAGIGKDKFSATGRVSGVLPAVIDGVSVSIDKGKLAVKDGGVIQYKSSATGAAAARSEYAGHAFKALENFTYKELEASIDGPLDGEMALKIVFEGNNPDVLSAQPFLFNTEIKGELANIVRNLSNAFSTQENLERVLEIKKGEATTP